MKYETWYQFSITVTVLVDRLLIIIFILFFFFLILEFFYALLLSCSLVLAHVGVFFDSQLSD